MNPGTSPRVRIALSLSLPVILIAGISLLRVDTTTGDAALPPPAPQFLTWSGDPFDDGRNHFIVLTEPAAVPDEGLFHRDADGRLSVTADTSDSLEVSVDELDALASGETLASVLGEPDMLGALEGVTGVESVRPLGFGLVSVAGSVTASDLELVEGVTQVHRDAALTAASVDEHYPSQWGLENEGTSPESWPMSDDADIDATLAWHRTRGAGVVVAVIDSGVDITHPDLDANIWHNSGEICGNAVDDDANGYVDDCDGWNFAAQVPDVQDLNGHGTHVAGIIAAEANNGIGIAGVAYESKVMVLKIGDQTPTLAAAIEAFAYAIDNGAHVINASWIIDEPNAGAILDPALDAAEAAGILVVAGAGNDGADIDTNPVYPAASPSPAVIAVGASDAQDHPAAYSGYGAVGVDLFAPGEHIVSTLPGGSYGAFSGTSMAAPMVSGAAALLKAATPAATASEVKGALLDRSDGPNDGVTTFRGLAASDGRLNVGRSIYSRLFQPSLMFTFHDFNSFAPDELHPVRIQAQTIDPWIAHPQTPSQYRASLYVPLDGEPMAVVDYPIVHFADGERRVARTDGAGRALVGDLFEPQQRPALVQDGDFTDIELELPVGTYAFVMEIVDVGDPNAPTRQGDPSAVFFTVGIDGSITEMPGTPVGSGGGATPPMDPTTTGGPTTTSGGGSTIPGDGEEPPDITTSTIVVDAGSTTTTTSDGGPTTTVASTSTAPPTTSGDDGDSGSDSSSTTTTTTAPETSTTTPDSTTTTAAPGGDSPTTTGSPTTTTIVDAGPRITDVDPASGSTAGGTVATITGVELPADPTVWFGERQAEIVVVASPTFIVVDTPPAPAGPVDVRVVDDDAGVDLVYVDGFTYVDPTDGTATTTTTVAPTTTGPEDDGGGAPPATPPTDPTDGESLDEWLDGVLVTPEGLTLAPAPSDSPLFGIPVTAWVGELCEQPVCPGWVLEG